MKTELQSRVAWSNSTTTSWNGNLTSVIYVEDILVCKNRYDWSPSSGETLFCNLYLECSSLNRKFCWALGSIYCLTHDNQVPLQVWDVDAFIFSFCAVFLLQWWQYLRPLAVTSSSVEGKVFLSKLQEGVPPSFRSTRWHPLSKLAFLWAGDWTWWPPGLLLT